MRIIKSLQIVKTLRKAKKIPVPKEWDDLKNPVYHDHVGMSAPSRSGTTHLTVETVLQGEGWEKGWATWKEIAGNFKMVTECSFGVLSIFGYFLILIAFTIERVSYIVGLRQLSIVFAVFWGDNF